MNYLFICLSFRSLTHSLTYTHTETVYSFCFGIPIRSFQLWYNNRYVMLYAWKKRMYLSNGGTPKGDMEKNTHRQFQTYPERLPLGSVPFQCIAQQLQPIEQVIQYLSTFYSKHRTFYEPTFFHKPIRRVAIMVAVAVSYCTLFFTFCFFIFFSLLWYAFFSSFLYFYSFLAPIGFTISLDPVQSVAANTWPHCDLHIKFSRSSRRVLGRATYQRL